MNKKIRCRACEKLFFKCFSCKNIISEYNYDYVCSALNNKHYCDENCYTISVNKIMNQPLKKCEHIYDILKQSCKICKIKL